MATYIIKSTSSDIGGGTFSRELSTGLEVIGTFNVSVPNSSTATGYAVTPNYTPSNNDWETAGITVEANVVTASSAISLRVRAQRISSTGTVLQSSGYTATQSLGSTGVKTFSIPSTNWSAGNCGDRLRIEYEFASSNAHGGAQSVTLQTGGSNSETTTSITEFAGSCPLPATTASDDFQSYSTGGLPSGWTHRYTLTGNSFSIVDVGSGDKALRSTITTGGTERVATMNAADSLYNNSNIEALIKGKSSSAAGYQLSLYLRATGETTPTHTSYQVQLNGQVLELSRYVNATWAAITSTPFTWSANQWVWIRYRLNGSTHQIKAWLDGNPEPAGWNINTTNSDISGAGRVGVGGYDVAGLRDYTYVSVASNGDTAPSPAPAFVAPTVTTSAATNVGQTGATGNGNVTDDGGDTITNRGFVWATTANPVIDTPFAGSVFVAGTTGAFSGGMTGLSAGTLYNYRAFATNSAGTSYGPNTTFTTSSATAAPSVTTSPESNVGLTSFQANGNVTSDNGAAITERGFVWVQGTGTPTTSSNKVTVAGTTGAYSTSISGLTQGTVYTYRAYAINSIGTSYGATEQVTTATPAPPTVTTQAATDVKAVTATFNGNITATGPGTVTERGFAYMVGTSGTPTTSNSTTSETGTFSTGAYSLTTDQLSGETSYRVRAYATSEHGTSYGATIQIATKTAISSIEDLNNIRNNVTSSRIVGDYVLTRDLDFEDDASYDNPANKAQYLSGQGWVPLGQTGNPWYGANFDGDGHTISNLMVNDSTSGQSNAGLFGVTDSATIQNLGLINPRINANATNNAFNQVGALVMGIDTEGVNIIRNCFVRGGRVVGGDGSGNNGTGGLVGIAHEYSTGSLLIENCYSESVEVVRNTSGGGTKPGVGGLVGNFNQISTGASSFMNISKSYAASPVSSSRTGTMGGILGQETATNVNVTNSYYDYEVTGFTADAGGATPRTTAQMYDLSTYTNWDIADLDVWENETWYIEDDANYPRLFYEGINFPPTVTASTTDGATFGTARPSVEFVGVDPSTNTIDYHIQINDTGVFTEDSVDNFNNLSEAQLNVGGVTGDANSAKRAQSFTASATGYLTEISAYLAKLGSPTDDLRLVIYSDNSGNPGTVIAQSDNLISLADLVQGQPGQPGIYDEKTFTFRTAHIQLQSSTRYWFSFERTGALDAVNHFAVTGSSTIAYGSELGRIHNGTSWVATGVLSIWFRQSYNPSPYIVNVISDNPNTTGFTNVTTPGDDSPFLSGDTVAYTMEQDLDGGTYYWRVRATDPAGSGRWSDWTTNRSFSIALNQSPTVNLNNLGGGVDTYYFSGHAGVTDSGNVWSNDTNAADGSTSTAATTTASSNVELDILGTNAPSSQDEIVSVRARLYSSTVGVAPASAFIYTQNKAEMLKQIDNPGSTADWSSYQNLNVPTGGWTWEKIQNLVAVARHWGIDGNNSTNIFRIEVEVTFAALSTTATPTFEFTGTDPEADDIRYNVQVDTVDTFDSQVWESHTAGSGVGSSIQGGTATSGEFNQAYGQSVLVNSSRELASIEFNIKKVGSPTDNLSVSVHTTSPAGTLVATSNTVSGSSLTTGLAWTTFTFATQPTLSSGTTYYFNIERSGARDTLNYYQSEYSQEITVSYPGGRNYRKNNNVWDTPSSPTSGNDLTFILNSTSTIPLLDKLSGTNSGFSGSPDNTDPFTSGQQVSYTVQSGDELSAGTYYWRVRAIDPSGSNTYGAWSETRSFTIASPTAAIGKKVVHNGTAWVYRPVKFFIGGAWTPVSVKKHNGSEWLPTNSEPDPPQ